MKERLKQLRKDAGLRQEDLAEALGCGIASVQNWESGKTVSIEWGLRIAEYYEVNLDFLYLGRGEGHYLSQADLKLKHIEGKEADITLMRLDTLKGTSLECYQRIMGEVRDLVEAIQFSEKY